MPGALVKNFKDAMSTINLWLLVRLAIIASGAIGGLWPGIQIDPANLSSLDVVMSSLIFFIVSAVGIFLLLAYGFLAHPKKGREWQPPSWRVNPFKEPLQMFHLGAFYFIASGLAFFLTQILKETNNLKFPLELISCGMGLWLGIHLYVKVFPHNREAPVGGEFNSLKPPLDVNKFRESHAFVLRGSDIETLWHFLQVHGAVVATVRFHDSPERRVSSPQEVIRLENSGKRQIEAMQFTSQTNTRTTPHFRQLEFSNRRGSPIEWEIFGDEENISRLNCELKILIKRLNPWYGKISEMNFFSLMPIGGMMGGLVSYLMVARIEWRFILEQMQMSPALFLGIPLLIIFWLLVPLGLNQLRGTFFPLASFAIGQGKANHQIKETRRLIIIVAFGLLMMMLLLAVYHDASNQ